MKQWVIGVAAGVSLAVPATAAAQRGGWSPPDCELSTGHYLVNSAVLYLRTAATTRFDDEKNRQLKDAQRVLLQALSQGQEDNGAVWYFLGRYYAEVDDVDGMDSAFDRASRLVPECAEDLRTRRRRLWVPLLNAGVERIRAGDNAAAKDVLYRANALYDSEPPGFYYLGQIYANSQQPDSAVKYFSRTVEIASDSLNLENEQYRELWTDAMFNVGSIHHRQERYDSAIAWYGRYRALHPTDPQGLTRLADVLADAGRNQEAIALYDSILLRADSMGTLDLFRTGVAMFQAKRFRRAAEAFEKGLQRNPGFRDALFNLSNTYLSLANASDSAPNAEAVKKELGQKMTPVARRLVEVDPYNKSARRLLAAAYQLRNMPDTTLAVLEDAELLEFDVTVSRFLPAGSGFEVRGIVTNTRDAATQVPPLVFEFVTEGGEVVQAITVDAQTIEGGGLAPFTMAPVGEAIAAWRYRAGT